jgi:bla regulator protein BlaR1
MNLNFFWMGSEWTQALGWTFVHSIWQIALIGLALFIVLRFVPKQNANARYTIATMALWLIVCVSLSTFMIMLPNDTQIFYTSDSVVMVGGNETLAFTERVGVWIENRMPMMLTIWAGGVAILMIRLLFGLGWIRHVRSSAIPEKEIQLTLNSIISRLQLKIKPLVANTAYVSSPMTIGHLKPMVLFPIGILNQLSPKEVEAILTHELAHIIRKDYLSNLVQSFIETLFYYHPITWWISSTVRAERENRADDLAVAWCGDQLEYAKALMAVQEMQVARGPSLAIGFASQKGAMLARIKRILNVPHKNHNQMEKTVLLSLTTLCFLAFTLTSHTQTDQSSKDKTVLETTVTLTKVTADSIPTKGIYRIHKKTNEQEISVEVEDGAIRELKVDGKEVAPSDFDGYDITINELFGHLQAPKTTYSFEMPNMPPMPEDLFDLEYDFEMPPMPDLSELNMELYLDGHPFHSEGGSVGDIQIFTRRMDDGNGTVMIYVDGDTIVQEINIGDLEAMPGKFLEEYRWNVQGNAGQWTEQMDAYKEAMRREMEAHGQQQDAIRYEIRRSQALENERDIMRYELRELKEDPDRENILIENFYGPSTGVYALRSNRLSLTDQMVKDGLVKPGSEVEVQLTPDRLKINGEKMPDSIHEKYLELYEAQQGIELSGKSKVEFTTKSKQRL